MRINSFIASVLGISRREADKLILAGRIEINQRSAQFNDQVTATDKVQIDGKLVEPQKPTTIMLNKPAGYVCSRTGQGSKTVYDLLPKKYCHLKPVGRLDKDSSGLLLLTNEGQLANKLTHPRYAKEKVYEVKLDKPLSENDRQKIEKGVMLEDGLSRLRVKKQDSRDRQMSSSSQIKLPGSGYEVRLSEGRNRQIRRTFGALNYKVILLHRTKFGNYRIGNLAPGSCVIVSNVV